MADNNVDLNTNSNQSDIKPCFDVSDEKIFINLHNAASERAAEVLGLNAKEIGMTIVNTGISKDGNNLEIVNKTSKLEKTMNYFKNHDNKYEVGIILEVEDFQDTDLQGLTTTEKILEKIHMKNESSIDRIKDKIRKALEEYFLWFGGEDAKKNVNIDSDKESMFIPDYNNKTLVIKNYEIQGMKDGDLSKYFNDRGGNVDSGNNGSNAKKNRDLKPRIGYKQKYTITFDIGQVKVDNNNKRAEAAVNGGN